VSDSAHVLQAKKLCFEYRPNEPVLKQISFNAPAGKFTCLLGPNGSGKTTLLRCLLGRLLPQSGSILLDGKVLGGYSPRLLAQTLAYVPQQPNSAFAFNVKEIILMGRFAHTGLLGLAGESDQRVANLAMEMTQTHEFSERTLDEISGGEAQRVMIARALAQQPAVMLLDEPTSHLDMKHQLIIYRMMQRLAHDWKMAVVCVSHDINLAARFADELVFIHDGELVAAGQPTEVITSDILQKVYDIETDLIPTPSQDVPMVRGR